MGKLLALLRPRAELHACCEMTCMPGEPVVRCDCGDTDLAARIDRFLDGGGEVSK